MERERKCPKCQYGTLGKLTKEERQMLSLNTGKHVPDGTLGCDECQYHD